jgi:predicted alpha/beta-fold hydrolase
MLEAFFKKETATAIIYATLSILGGFVLNYLTKQPDRLEHVAMAALSVPLGLWFFRYRADCSYQEYPLADPLVWVIMLNVAFHASYTQQSWLFSLFS